MDGVGHVLADLLGTAATNLVLELVFLRTGGPAMMRAMRGGGHSMHAGD